MSRSVFVFLDSEFRVPQHIQLQVIANYTSANNLAIDFYGNEICGTEEYHLQLESYMSWRNIDEYLFFSLEQFITKDGLQSDLLKKILAMEKQIHFASQKIHLTKEQDITELILLSLALASKGVHQQYLIGSG